jgi:phenylacetate-CoA ligase
VVNRLRNLILSASQSVPFYAKHWGNLTDRLHLMHFPEQLRELPIVQKADLLSQEPSDLLDRRFQGKRLEVEKTSGSSGQPIAIQKDRSSTRRRSLRFLRALFSCGYRPGQLLLIISTRRTAGMMKWARWHYADLRDENLLQDYQSLRPAVLYGPLTSLLQICEQAQLAGIQLHRPTVVISTAEQLMSSQRTQLEDSFDCQIADFYGMTEVGLIAFRRPGATAFMRASNDLILEFEPLPDDTSADRLIVTDVTGGARPVIRYDTGDLVRRVADKQPPVIQEFVGRRIDSVVLRDGRRVSPYRLTMSLEAVPHIKQYQVVQRSDLSLDVYFHSDERHTDAIGQKLFTVLSDICGDMPTRVHFHKHATTNVAGKFRPVQSEVRVGA